MPRPYTEKGNAMTVSIQINGGSIGNLHIVSPRPIYCSADGLRSERGCFLLRPFRRFAAWWSELSFNDRMGYGLVWFFCAAAIYCAVATPFVLAERARQQQAYIAAHPALTVSIRR